MYWLELQLKCGYCMEHHSRCKTTSTFLNSELLTKILRAYLAIGWLG